MALTGAIKSVRACLLVGAQIAGGIFASFLVKVLFPTKFNVRTTLSKNTSLAQGVFIEAILTAELVFTVRSDVRLLQSWGASSILQTNADKLEFDRYLCLLKRK